MEDVNYTPLSPLHSTPGKPKSRWLLSGVAVFGLAAALWGVGLALSRARGWGYEPWAVIVIPSLIVGGLVLRRLRWWLLLVLPIAWISMSFAAVSIEVAIQPLVNSIALDDTECKNSETFAEGIAQISLDVSTWRREFDSSLSGGPSPYRTWAETWRSVAGQYQELPEVEGSADYLRFSIEAAQLYAAGFDRLALNDLHSGGRLLEQGDDAIANAQAAFVTVRLVDCSSK